MTTLAAWLHDLNPIIFRISGDFAIRWYGFAYVAGFVVGWLLLRALAVRGVVRIPPRFALDAVVIASMGVVLGGRLGYVIIYNPSLLITFEPAFPFWGVLDVIHGGMASHGGMIGVGIAAILIARGFKTETGERIGACPRLHVLDALALTATPGLLFGRIANFVNGELLGKVVAGMGEPGPWWAVKFPQEATQRWDELTDVQQAAYARMTSLSTETSLIYRSEDVTRIFEKNYEGILTKLQQGSVEAAKMLEPVVSARHPSQLYQALCEGIILGGALLLIWARPRKPGVIVACFMMIYGVLRIVTEFWRLPDAGSARTLGLSTGQWLSALLFAGGLAFLMFALKRKSEPLGGWMPKSQPEAR